MSDDDGKRDDAKEVPVDLGGLYDVVAPPPTGAPVYEHANEGADVVARLTVANTELAGAGNTVEVQGETWIEIEGEHAGWVPAEYLTESVASDDFCFDARVWRTLDALTTASGEVSDGAGFAEVVSPDHGISVHLAPDGDGTRLAAEEAWETLQTKQIEWGTQVATGQPLVGTFADLALVELRDVLNGTDDVQDIRCNRFPQGSGPFDAGVPEGFFNLNFVTVSIAYDGSWLTWAIGIAYVNETPYVTYLARLGLAHAS